MAWMTNASDIKIVSHEVIIDEDPRTYVKRAEYFDKQDKSETADDEYDTAIRYSHGAAKYWFKKAKFEKETYEGGVYLESLFRGLLRLTRPIWLFLLSCIPAVLVHGIPIVGEPLSVLFLLISPIDLIYRLVRGIKIDWYFYGKAWGTCAVLLGLCFVASLLMPVLETIIEIPGIGKILNILFMIVAVIFLISTLAVFLYTAYMSIAMVIDMLVYSVSHRNIHVHRQFKTAMPMVAGFALGIFAGYLGVTAKNYNNHTRI